MMGIGSKVGFVPIFHFFSLPVLRARYSLPVTVTSRFESLNMLWKVSRMSKNRIPSTT